MLEKVAPRILTAADYPWVKDPREPQTLEEHAYNCGQHIARTRRLLNDDALTEIINWGAGPNPDGAELDIENLRRKDPAVGSFGMFVAIEPDDLELYRQILPQHFSMPDNPALSLINVDYNQPNQIRRYKEGMILLKGVGGDGEEAWYVHSMPVESWLMLLIGHDWGFRKEIFNMTVTREETTVTRLDGEFYMALELTEEPWPQDADGIVPREVCGGHNNMAVTYPENQNMMLRFGWSGKAIALDEEQRMVRITVNRDLDWAGLVPKGTVSPGRYMRYAIEGSDSYVKKIR